VAEVYLAFRLEARLLIAQKIEATLASGLFLDLIRGIISPHTGQSSQLLADANDRNAQFLATVVRSALVLLSPINQEFAQLCYKD